MITPFKLFIKDNFPFVEDTYQALDNYGLLCKIVEKLNEVIADENEISIKVDDFISTLDFTQEVSDKLDEMAEDGTLAEIINSEIFGTLNEQVTQNTSDISGISSNIGALTDLNTDTKTSIVAAINEVLFKLNYKVGTLTNLTTETKSDTVAAINEVNGKIGDLDYLETTAKTDVVAAINEVNNKDNYSTTEQVVGMYKGKPLYRKLLEVDLTSEHSTNYTVQHGVSNLERFTYIGGILERSSNAGFVPINSYNATSYRISVVSTATALNIQNMGYVGNAKYILEYTKATDPEPVG